MSITFEVIDMVNSAIEVLGYPMTETLMGKNMVARDHPQSPLPVVVSALFEQSSDTIVDIIGLCGVDVDWTLTKEEAYSHITRKRAYRPRIQTAFAVMSPESKLRIAWIIATELMSRDETIHKTLTMRLNPVGWKLATNGLVPADESVREMFFPTGSVHDAYVELRKILRSAESSIDIVDPYAGEVIFTLIGALEPKRPTIRILTSKLGSDFRTELQRFRNQHDAITIEVRQTRDFHDRFVVVDGRKCYHVGASIQHAGQRAMMINKVEDEQNARVLIGQMASTWASATIV